jgi:hypothetical protein
MSVLGFVILLFTDWQCVFDALGPRHIACSGTESCSEAEPPLSRGFHQEPLCWQNVYHAWSADEVCIFMDILSNSQVTFFSFLLHRRKNVRRKLNAMALEFSGKNVLLVDGSV